MITNFPAFVGIALLVILSPGQDTALTIRNTLVGGRAGGIATATGVVSGLASWTVASSAGLAALLVASQPLFLAIRLIGAAYLIFLGLQALRAAIFSAPGQRTGPASPLGRGCGGTRRDRGRPPPGRREGSLAAGGRLPRAHSARRPRP